MNLLIIDNSQNTGRIALIQNGRLSAYKEVKSKEKRAGKILRAIETLLKTKKMEASDIDLVGWISGFGGFTSLRIAATIVNGVGYSLNIPIVATTWFEVLGKKAATAKNLVAWKNPRGDYFAMREGREPEVVDDLTKIPKGVVVVSNDNSLADIYVESLDTKALFLEAVSILEQKAKQKRGGYKLSLPLYMRKAVN